MSKIVEKWVAGFWSGKLIVVKWKFRETPKKFIMVREDDSAYRQASIATSFKIHFRKDEEPKIFDTSGEALSSLHKEVTKTIQQNQRRIELAQKKLNQIDNFDLTLE